MTKAAILFLGLAALIALPAIAPAQDNPTAIAVNEAVLRQANTIVLRQKLAEARKVQLAGDVVNAAKLYQESCDLAQKIGSGIDAESAQAVRGLTETRLALARAAQSRGDLREAATQSQQVLKADPNNSAALAFKKQNDQMIAAMKGHIPSAAATEQVPQVVAQKTDAGTLVQDGKLFYEMGKLDDAEAKLKQALALDVDNAAAYYYMNLIQQARFARESSQHTIDTQTRMAQVEKQWVLPNSNLPKPNPYATNDLVYTGPGRQAIISKLDHIRLPEVNYDAGMPLSEVIRDLAVKVKNFDPERKGINFLINPNGDQSGQPVASATAMPGGAPGASSIDPATGLPSAAPAPAAGGGGGGGESSDAGAFMVKISNLADVRLADVLDAITMVAQSPTPGDGKTIKYTITDFAVIFQVKGAENPQLFSRVFKVDPNTFYSGLESVSAMSFGGSGNSGGGGGGGGGSSGGGGGGSSQNNGGGVVGIVNAFEGAGSFRSSGNGQGGGGGGGGSGSATDEVNASLKLSSATSASGSLGGGLKYITRVTMANTPSSAVISFFNSLGVNLSAPPGKSVFFNDRLGKLFVKATEQDLDTIERAIETMNEVAPQVHIKSRFIEVSQNDSKALGFDWYLGGFNVGNQVTGSGGTAPSATVPPSAFNPGGTFPGLISPTPPNALTDQLLTGGLRNAGPTLGTLTGIFNDTGVRMALHALEQRDGVESLAEPEVTTTSGRQTQMRATTIRTVITGVNTQTSSGSNAGNTGGNTGGNVNNVPQTTFSYITTPIETGPILDVVPYVLSDGYTINLALIPSVTEFIGYDTLTANAIISGSSVGTGSALAVASPIVLPDFTVRQVVTTVNVWDNQTVVLGGLISSTVSSVKDKVPMIADLPVLGRLFQSQSKATVKKNLMIFVTATIVDPAGNRVHADDDLPFAQNAVPSQPPGAGQVQETVKEVHSLPAANP